MLDFLISDIATQEKYKTTSIMKGFGVWNFRYYTLSAKRCIFVSIFEKAFL